MIDNLERIVGDVASLNTKLVLLVGRHRSGKSALLGELSGRLQVQEAHPESSPSKALYLAGTVLRENA